MEKEFWLATSRFLILIVSVVALLVGLYFVLPIIFPFLIGLLLAFMFNPLVTWGQHRLKIPRWLSVLIVIFVFIGVAATLLSLGVIQIASEVNKLQDTFQDDINVYIEQVESFLIDDVFAFYNQFTHFFSALDPDVQRNIENYVQQFANDIVLLVSSAITSFIETIIQFLGSVPLLATGFVFSLLAAFFFSKDWQKWEKTFRKVIPSRLMKRGKAVTDDLRYALFGYVRAQIILMSISFVIIFIGFLIMNLPYALTLSIIMGLLDLVPYVGPGLIFVPWIIYLFITGDYAMVIGLSIIYGLVIIQRQILEPKVLGANVGLDPLSTLFALFVGFSVFGVVGLILGPVLMVIIGALYRAGVFKEMWAFVKGEKT